MAVERWYDFHEIGSYLGNVSQFQTVRVDPSTPERGASILVSTREAVISVLPEASLELLREIEDFAKLDITFELREKPVDRKSTRLNSSHKPISYAVFCVEKKKKTQHMVTAAPMRAPGFYV